MDHSFASAGVAWAGARPFDRLPLVILVTRNLAADRPIRVVLHEAGIAFAMLGCMLSGHAFLRLMHLSERSRAVAGGVVLPIIAMRMNVGNSISAAVGKPMGLVLATPVVAMIMVGLKRDLFDPA